jgi:hypothetical protein
MWRNFPLQATMMSERVARIQTDSSDPLSNIGKALHSRVETAHDSVAMAMMAKQQDKAQKDRGVPGESPTVGYNTPQATEVTPRLPFPLRSPSLIESALFQRLNSSSMISTTWSPVLLCLSSAGHLHIFDVDPKGEMGTDTSAFSNVAHQSKKGIELEIFNTAQPSTVTPSTDSTLSKPPAGDLQSLSFILQTESFMAPTLSFCVPRCTVQFTPTANDTTFEVVENTPNTGVGSLFRSMSERRYVLYGTVLYCSVLHYTVLYRSALYCTVLHYTVLCCTVLRCDAMRFTTLLH